MGEALYTCGGERNTHLYSLEFMRKGAKERGLKWKYLKNLTFPLIVEVFVFDAKEDLGLKQSLVLSRKNPPVRFALHLFVPEFLVRRAVKVKINNEIGSSITPTDLELLQGTPCQRSLSA